MASTPDHTDELIEVAGTRSQVLKGHYLWQTGCDLPVNYGELYQYALANTTLWSIDGCGRSPALEKPQEFLHTVRAFLAQR
jgi:pimeloyl-ACP methyl ester carboxylesterase